MVPKDFGLEMKKLSGLLEKKTGPSDNLYFDDSACYDMLITFMKTRSRRKKAGGISG